MDSLDSCYVQLLHIGFSVLRQALDCEDGAWVKAELEFLHNIPSLLGEVNVNRHRYFWLQERDRYLKWIEENGSDQARSRMRTFYEPILEEMASAMEERGWV